MSDLFQPRLSDDLVSLRPLQVEDERDLQRVMADPALWDQHPDDRHLPERFSLFFTESINSGGALLVSDTQTHEVIGTTRLAACSKDAEFVEVGWTVLAKAYWGGRYNLAMKQLLVDHLATHERSALLNIAPGNLRSARAAEKIGGVLASSTHCPQLIDPRPGYLTYVLPVRLSAASA